MKKQLLENALSKPALTFMESNKNIYLFSFSKDTLDTENYSFTAGKAYRSRNIHPILRYYKHPIKGNVFLHVFLKSSLLLL